jgi:hypothetical protein
MLCIVITLAVFNAALAALAFLAVRRLMAHMRRTPEAVKAITEHVLLPLFERRPEEPPPAEPQAEAGPLPE